MVKDKNEERGWTSGTDLVPHDARQRVWGMKRGRLETMQQFGLKPEVVPDLSRLDGINAARRLLPRCVFHPRCEEQGIAALEQYRREWDDDKKCFRETPLHDWASNLSDAFRYMAVGWRELPVQKPPPPKPEYAVEDGYALAPPLPGQSRRA